MGDGELKILTASTSGLDPRPCIISLKAGSILINDIVVPSKYGPAPADIRHSFFREAYHIFGSRSKNSVNSVRDISFLSPAPFSRLRPQRTQRCSCLSDQELCELCESIVDPENETVC